MITKKDRKTLLKYIKSDFCMCLSNNESIRLENIFNRYIKSNKNAKILTIYNDVHALFNTDNLYCFCGENIEKYTLWYLFNDISYYNGDLKRSFNYKFCKHS